MNKRIFLTLAAVLITGAILYKMPSWAAEDTETRSSKQAGSSTSPRWNRRARRRTSDFGRQPVQSNIQYLQEQAIALRSQITHARLAEVTAELSAVITPENQEFLSPIHKILLNTIQWLNHDYVDLLKQINDEREWANNPVNPNNLHHTHARIKIEALEKRVAELEAAAAAQTTEY